MARPPAETRMDPPRHAGAPSSFNLATCERIIALVRAGNYLDTAAVASGVDKRTFLNWMKKGAEAEKLLRDDPTFNLTEQELEMSRFFRAVHTAQAEAEARDVMLIGKHAQKDWRAAAFRLERRATTRWGRTERIEMTGAEGGPIQHQDVTDPAALLKAKLAEIARNRAGDDDKEGGGNGDG